jgi:hypothetical protein
MPSRPSLRISRFGIGYWLERGPWAGIRPLGCTAAMPLPGNELRMRAHRIAANPAILRRRDIVDARAVAVLQVKKDSMRLVSSIVN